MMMLLPILGALIHTARWRWEPWAYRVLAVGVFFRGMTTYSRGGFLAAGVLGVIAFLRSEKKLRAAVAVLVLGLLVWGVMPQAFWDRMGTITTTETSEGRDESAAGRLHFWGVAVDMARAKPLTGVGLNGFPQSQETYDPNSAFGTGRAAHSIWFGVLADLGYPGLILFVANILMAIWSAWRVVRLTRAKPEYRDVRIFGNALLSSLVVYVVAGTFLSHHYNEMAWHLIGLSTALYLITRRELASVAPASVQRTAA
jgi:probable O-glycosylation ligase (exosortase A-associated)